MTLLKHYKNLEISIPTTTYPTIIPNNVYQNYNSTYTPYTSANYYSYLTTQNNRIYTDEEIAF
jgi:hypothetical protein